MRLKIASRQSDLAKIQAYNVGDALKKHNSKIEIEYLFRESLGDKNLNDPLWQMPEKGVFTQDFRDDLLYGRCDMVVHSWKDLPVQHLEGTEIVATLPRADQRDLMLFKKSAADKKTDKKLTILTSSPRRSYNLSYFLKEFLPFEVQEVVFEPVRGNIPTRLKKLMTGEAQALVVAKAGLDRLLAATQDEFKQTQKDLRKILSETHWMILPLSMNPTAAAQGAIAVEVASHRRDLIEVLQNINSSDDFKAVRAERYTLAKYGGGCHQKIGVSLLIRSYGAIKSLKGKTDAGETLDEFRLVRPDFIMSKTSKEKIFPRPEEEVSLFDREDLPVEQPQDKHKGLFVAKFDALPKDWQISHDTIVWASGLETFKKLSNRGIWVNGCSESLGEGELMNVDELVPPHMQWYKLTHADGNENADMKIIAGYRLKPKEANIDFSERTHFFWSSGSAFQRALELNPEIKDKNHSCGPGNSYNIICNTLGSASHVTIFLNYEDWLKEVLL